MIADRAFAGLAPAMKQNPLALTEALLALDWTAGQPREIAIVWPRDAGAEAARPLLDVVRRTFVPNHALVAAADADAAAFAKLVPFIADKVAIDGRPTAYVCTRGRCDLPVHDPAALAARLAPQIAHAQSTSVSVGRAPGRSARASRGPGGARCRSCGPRVCIWR